MITATITEKRQLSILATTLAYSSSIDNGRHRHDDNGRQQGHNGHGTRAFVTKAIFIQVTAVEVVQRWCVLHHLAIHTHATAKFLGECGDLLSALLGTSTAVHVIVVQVRICQLLEAIVVTISVTERNYSGDIGTLGELGEGCPALRAAEGVVGAVDPFQALGAAATGNGLEIEQCLGALWGVVDGQGTGVIDFNPGCSYAHGRAARWPTRTRAALWPRGRRGR